MKRLKLAVLSSSFVLLPLLAACGPGGAGNGAPVNCRLAGFSYPEGAPAPVESCPTDWLCAQLEGGDAGATLPICVKQVPCGSLSCASARCGDAQERSPSEPSCLR